MKRASRIVLFSGFVIVAVIATLVTAWIAPGVTTIGVGFLAAIGGLIAIGGAAAIAWFIRRDLRIAVSWAILTGGVFVAVPLHEVLHAIPVLIAGDTVSFRLSVTSLKMHYEPMPEWLETLRFSTPFFVSAAATMLIPVLVRKWDHRMRPWEELMVSAILGSIVMSNAYAVTTLAGMVGKRGDLFTIAHNLSFPAWSIAFSVMGLHMATGAGAALLTARWRKSAKRTRKKRRAS